MTSRPAWRLRPLVESDVWSQRFTRAATGTGPLDGCRVAVKDLFDVAGVSTLAGRAECREQPSAAADADAVGLLRAAGAALVGHTTMTQLAFSGVGQNPDFGHTAGALSPDGQAYMAGGSSRGSALAVAHGLADIGLGTDTGGSCRIPAACNGLYGFKPTARRVSLRGAMPLAPSLDSVGVISADLAQGVAAMQVMLGAQAVNAPLPRLFVPSFACAGCDEAVRSGFEWAIGRLQAVGFRVERRELVAEVAYRELQSLPSLASIEAYQLYPDARALGVTDPSVVRRIQLGAAADGARVRALRTQLMNAFAGEVGADLLLMPTLPWLPPLTAAAEDPASFDDINRQALHNSAFVNLADGCAVSIPLPSDVPVSVTLAAPAEQDERLWGFANELDRAVN